MGLRPDLITRTDAACTKPVHSELDQAEHFDFSAFLGFLGLILRSISDAVRFAAFVALLMAFDLLICLLDALSPRRTPATIIPPPFSPFSPPPIADHPVVFCLCWLTRLLGPAAPAWMREWAHWEGIGADGRWPAFVVWPGLKPSRSPCPALNAMANHGIIDPTGRRLSFHTIAAAASRTYNLSPSLAVQLLAGAWPLFQTRGTIDLVDLCTHGVIEHDASLLRPDTYPLGLEPQTRPDLKLIDRFFPSSKRTVTSADLSLMLRTRRAECKVSNGFFHDKFLFRYFGSGNCAMFIKVFGGNVAEIRKWTGATVNEMETIPDDLWRPRNPGDPWGVPILKMVYTTLKIEARA